MGRIVLDNVRFVQATRYAFLVGAVFGKKSSQEAEPCLEEEVLKAFAGAGVGAGEDVDGAVSGNRAVGAGEDVDDAVSGTTSDEEATPSLPADQRMDGSAVYCPDCQMWLNGPTQWQDHRIGKKHRTNVVRAKNVNVRPLL